MLRRMTPFCVLNIDSLPSSLPKLWPIKHFSTVSLYPGLKLVEFHEETSAMQLEIGKIHTLGLNINR